MISAMDVNYSTYTIQTSNDAMFMRALIFIAGLVCVDDLVNQKYCMHVSLIVKSLLYYVWVRLRLLVRDVLTGIIRYCS